MHKMLAKFLKCEEGTTAVEFSLIAFGFLALVFGIFECGRMFMTWNAFQYTIEDTTRRALISEDITAEEIEDTIRDSMPNMMLESDRADIDVIFTDYSGVNILEVSGVYSFSPIVLTFLPDSWSTINLRAESRFPMSWE